MSFTAVVMAAGQGTRMRSAVPKVLHPVCGRPMVHWPVLAAQAAGAERVVVVAGPDGALEGRLPDGVVLAVQPVADGTGGAVLAAAEHLEGADSVVVLSGDVPLVTAEAIGELVDAHLAARAGATMATTVLDDATGYGRVVRAADGTVERVVETKAPGDATQAELALNEVNTGIFCFDAEALLAALPEVGTDNAQGEKYLPDVLPVLRATGRTVAAHVVDDPGLVLGVNDRAHLAQVERIAQARVLDELRRGGVTIREPASIDVSVTIGQDTVVEPGCVLRGGTAIGAGCTVGPDTTLVDTTLGDGASAVKTYANGASTEGGVSVGPFAYLRPGTVLRARSKVGTFVELKNTDLGEGSKVPHLSYVGDADVGPDTNLGASTITANYDGVRKHRTTIGARVKSSVHVSFVAPVTVGDDGWTAAGSTIVDDIPSGALGIARPRQTNVEGYASRRSEARG